MDIPFYNADKYAPQDEENKERRIDNIFSDNKFRMFVGFCNTNNYKYIEDLKGFDFDILREIPGLGSKKIELILDKYNEFYGTDTINHEIEIVENVETLFNNINEELETLSIESLMAIGASAKQIRTFRANDFMLIGDLKNISKKIMKIFMYHTSLKIYVGNILLD